jgi:hypothetical protein
MSTAGVQGNFTRENTAVLASQSGCKQDARDGVRPSKKTHPTGTMLFSFELRRVFAVLCCAAALNIFAPAAFAQSGNGKPPEPQKPAADAPKADTAKEGQKKIDEIAEASRALSGAAGNPECVWLGRRVVSLLWRDDLDTAFRHLDLYDRFGCPGPHIQTTFRCLVRQGNIDPKQQETLNGRVHACWLNPNLEPAPATAAASPAQAPAATSGGTTQR